ncbi:hypothetical protein H4582DRAFT_2058128 [Lactarius indigo]|nr:hypothetical protein H4582DRAFT_2058128 [Lactarius indigo]
MSRKLDPYLGHNPERHNPERNWIPIWDTIWKVFWISIYVQETGCLTRTESGKMQSGKYSGFPSMSRKLDFYLGQNPESILDFYLCLKNWISIWDTIWKDRIRKVFQISIYVQETGFLSGTQSGKCSGFPSMFRKLDSYLGQNPESIPDFHLCLGNWIPIQDAIRKILRISIYVQETGFLSGTQSEKYSGFPSMFRKLDFYLGQNPESIPDFHLCLGNWIPIWDRIRKVFWISIYV